MAEELTIKEVLHQTIEDIDDDKVLYAAYTLLEKSRVQHIEPTEEQLNILQERDAEYQAGRMQVYTMEELEAEMKKNMAFKIEITLAAKQDLSATIEYYNNKSSSLGTRFYLHFKDAIQKIKLNPVYYSYYRKPFRRILIQNFPYLIIYKIYNNTVVVTGVLFGMINPEKIIDRTK